MRSPLYNHFYYCWRNETVTLDQLGRAVEKEFITGKEKEEITKTELKEIEEKPISAK